MGPDYTESCNDVRGSGWSIKVQKLRAGLIDLWSVVWWRSYVMPVIKILHVCSFSSEDPVSEVDYIHITSYFFPIKWICPSNGVTCSYTPEPLFAH